MRAYLASEIICILGWDYPFPSEPNRSRVQFRSGLQISVNKRQGFQVRGLFCQTLTSLGLKIEFFQLKISFSRDICFFS
jgi:hypothetical protein